VLVIVENFKGWEHGADWGDVTFFETHGDWIEKIGIVADPKWEIETLAFAGAGFRHGPVKFFPESQLTMTGPSRGDEKISLSLAYDCEVEKGSIAWLTFLKSC
jgi:hypothetical protein